MKRQPSTLQPGKAQLPVRAWRSIARLIGRIEGDLERDVMTFRGFDLGLTERPGPEDWSRLIFRPGGPAARIVYISIALIALIAFIVVGLWALLSDTSDGQFEWASIALCLLLAGIFAAIVRAAFIRNSKPLDPASLPARAPPPESLNITLAKLRRKRKAKTAGR